MNRTMTALLATLVILMLVELSTYSSPKLAPSGDRYDSQETPTPMPTPSPSPSPSPSPTPTPVPEPEPVPSPSPTPFDYKSLIDRHR
jgi:hypothetical protein